MKKSFEILADINSTGSKVPVAVEHHDETFALVVNENCIASILNNGDNTWQLVRGTLPQELINEIGDEIEKYYKELDPLS